MSNAAFEVRAAYLTDSESGWQDESQPRTNVTVSESMAFCEWRGGRLPTANEWEYAARGPDGLIYPWGNAFDSDLVVYEENSGGQPGAVTDHDEGESWVGALNMAGNVWKWTQPSEDGSLVRRGGGYDAPGHMQTLYTGVAESIRQLNAYTGFRCAMDYTDEIVAVITDPQPNTQITADTYIYGTALFNPFVASSYKIEISGGQYGAEWTQLHDEHTSSAINWWLETLYFDELETGSYRIRLRIRFNEGDDVFSEEVPFSVTAGQTSSACDYDWFFGNEYAVEGDCPLSESSGVNGLMQRFGDGLVIGIPLPESGARFLLLGNAGTYNDVAGVWDLGEAAIGACVFETVNGVYQILATHDKPDDPLGCPNQPVQEDYFYFQVADTSPEFVAYIGTSRGSVYRLSAASSRPDIEGEWQRIR